MKNIFCALMIGVSCMAFAEDDEPSVGMSMKAFIKMRGEPDKKELRDGKDVLWYDGNQPYFAVFKNKKLDSLFDDKDTVNQRHQDEMAEIQANERAEYQARAEEQQRRQNAMRAMQNFRIKPMEFHPMPVNRPVNTNCNMIGNQMNCSSY